MKFLCPKCERLVELRDFKLDGAVLVLTCPACSNASRVSPPSWAAGGSPAVATLDRSSAPSSAPVALVPLAPVVPTTTGERPALQLTSYPGASNVVALRSPGSDAVGLAAEASKSGPFEVPVGRCPKCIAPRQSTTKTCTQCGLTFSQFDSSQVAPGPWLKAAWISLLADWGNETRHAELRQRALNEQELAAVGRLYRLRIVACAEDPFAQRGRDEVLRMALVPSAPSTPSLVTEKIDARWKYVAVALVLVFSLAMLGLMARAMLTP